MSTGVNDLWRRPLLLTHKWRPLSHNGRRYGQTSAVPLAYVSMSDPLADVLLRFTVPTRPVDVFGEQATAADHQFVGRLLLAGVLRDAERPDPIHDYRIDPAIGAMLYLYPTNSCNLRCVYCYATSGPGAGPRLSMEHALMSIEDFFATLDERVRFVQLRFHGGGEPTTNFGVMVAAWQRFTELATDRGLRAGVSTITNGTFGPAVLQELRKPEWGLSISYDGPRQAQQRPTAAERDSRDRVVANIKALRAAGKSVGTRATLTNDGLPFMRALVDDAAEVGIAAVQVEPASIVGRGANTQDGPPDPVEFAEAFLDTFRYALESGVRLHTAAWSSTRIGDGRYCGAISGMRAVTPDGFVSACTECIDGKDPSDPFIVGQLNTHTRRLEIWPVRERKLQDRVGYNLPHCSKCYMVDTCGGGCASRARAETGDAFERDPSHCTIGRMVNPAMIADIADGRLLPDDGWQPISAELIDGESSVAGAQGRLVALVPPFARRAWNADDRRRPAFATGSTANPFFHLP